MLAVILPTSDVLRQFDEYELLFCFHENGVKGIIEKFILVNQNKECLDELFAEILLKYHHSPEVIFLHGVEKATFYLEILLELIEIAISEVMNSMFKNLTYTLTEKDVTWIGNDVKINLTLTNV